MESGREHDLYDFHAQPTASNSSSTLNFVHTQGYKRDFRLAKGESNET